MAIELRAELVLPDAKVSAPELICPHCGESDNFTFYEDISSRRSVNGINEQGDLEIEGFYETDGCDEDGENERLLCDSCLKECRIPDSLGVAFV